MKITQLMLARGFGGAERYFADLSAALAERGHDVQVICHKKFKQADKLKSIPSLKISEFSVAGWWDILAQGKILKAIEKHNPAIVQAHLARGAYMAGKACAQLGIPLTVKTHNYVDLKYYRNVDCFITTTADQRDYLLGRGIDRNRVVVIPNFSSIRPVNNVKAVTENRRIILASYGRFVRKKGFHLLLEAIKRIQIPEKQIVLHLGGDGPEYKSLLRQVENLGLEKQVKFCGWIDDVVDFVKDADIFILPSLDEPFGIAVLEMMALGIPVIATRTKGPLEILNENTAWLVPPDDVDALASAVTESINHPAERTQKAEWSLELFRKKYSRDVVVPELESLYERLVRQRSNNAGRLQV